MSDDHASPPGAMSRDAILAALNELIEAERAGTRVAIDTLLATDDAGLATLMRLVRRDEAHWCAMLTREVRRLGGVPSRRCGAFHLKAMAIADPDERIAFLNRGQAWVSRRLALLLPQVDDCELRDGLGRMLAGHDDNIRIAADFIAARSSQ